MKEVGGRKSRWKLKQTYLLAEESKRPTRFPFDSRSVIRGCLPSGGEMPGKAELTCLPSSTGYFFSPVSSFADSSCSRISVECLKLTLKPELPL